MRRRPSDEREARMAWSRVSEPGDPRVTALVESTGPQAALEAVESGCHDLSERLLPRFGLLDLDRDAEIMALTGIRVVVPGDEEWPEGLDDLPQPPHCLWVRGSAHLADSCRRSVSVVGARAATAAGQTVAADLAAGLAERRFAVVSGAAFGIDAAAHRGTLAVDGTTLAVLAGGVERPYPAAHEMLLRQICETGAVVSEVPPGSAPTRTRFLQRNRLIAALSQGTIVVEAGLRSGTLSTVGHAERCGRVVGAVPGPVSSVVSAGCHQLVRDARAVLVTDAAEAAELVGELGEDLAPEKRGPVLAEDRLGEAEAAVFSVLPVRSAAGVDDLAVRSARSPREVLSSLGGLELQGLAVRDGDRWRRPARR